MDHVDLFQPFVMHNHTFGEDNGFVNAIVWVNLDNYHLVKVRHKGKREWSEKLCLCGICFQNNYSKTPISIVS